MSAYRDADVIVAYLPVEHSEGERNPCIPPMSDKKKVYFASIVMPEEVVVKESGAAVVYIDPNGEEKTQQVSMYKLVGTSEEIALQLGEGVKAVLGIIDERLALEKKNEESRIIVPT